MTKINRVQNLVSKKLAGEEVCHSESDVESKYYHDLEEDDGWGFDSTQQIGTNTVSPKDFNLKESSVLPMIYRLNKVIGIRLFSTLVNALVGKWP